MDPEYNEEQALSFLQAAITEHGARTNEKTKDIYTIKAKNYRVIQISQPLSWRITKAENIDEPEEEIFYIHGILCGSDLPPIKTNDIAHLKKKVGYIRQAVRLTGLGDPVFTKAIENIAEIHGVMAKHIGNITLAPWQNNIYEGYDAIDTNARYFSLRKYVPNERGQAFGNGVDPNGVLASLRDQYLIHGHDNKVEYLKEEKGDCGNIKTIRTKPETFKIGDIVCASVSFVSFPTKGNGASMTIILRALTLVKSMTTVHELNCDANSTIIDMNKAINVIKRKTIFEDDNEDCKRIKNMNIDNKMDTSEGE